MTKALLRFSWLTLFIAQIVLYVLSYPYLARIVVHNSAPGGILANILVLDVLGGMSWCVVLILSEDFMRDQVKGIRWIARVLIGTCVILAIGVMYLNIHAWIEA